MNIKPLVACVPVADMPDWPAQVSYSAYIQVNCPACNAPMWLGERGRRACEAGKATMLCMRCALLERGPEAMAGMFSLTDLDGQR